MPSRKTARRAERADKQRLYLSAVQCAEAEVEFVSATFRRLRGRQATRLREDFCGTGAVACEWASRRPENRAVGLDIDGATLDWGKRYILSRLKPAPARRVTFLRRNVLRPGREGSRMDAVLAMNFSWQIFKTRRALLEYFRSVRRSMVKDGVFFLDICGGWESCREQKDTRRIAGGGGGFTYIWDQARFDPITGDLLCHIHFRFPDGSSVRKAFTYDWRLWTIPEVRDVLADAGFESSGVYWEGDDDKGGGNGVFTREEKAEQCPSFVAYIVAAK